MCSFFFFYYMKLYDLRILEKRSLLTLTPKEMSELVNIYCLVEIFLYPRSDSCSAVFVI